MFLLYLLLKRKFWFQVGNGKKHCRVCILNQQMAMPPTGHTAALSKEQTRSMPQEGPHNVGGRWGCAFYTGFHIWEGRNLASAGISWERTNGFLHSASLKLSPLAKYTNNWGRKQKMIICWLGQRDCLHEWGLALSNIPKQNLWQKTLIKLSLRCALTCFSHVHAV